MLLTGDQINIINNINNHLEKKTAKNSSIGYWQLDGKENL